MNIDDKLSFPSLYEDLAENNIMLKVGRMEIEFHIFM